MLVDIREVKKSRNGAMGNFLARGKYPNKYWVISISMFHCRTLVNYALTLLHELLHVWVIALRLKGFRVRGATEHRFINAAEDQVLRVIKYLRYTKKRKKKKRRKK